MKQETLFHQNIEMWIQEDPKQGVRLSLHEPYDVVFCKTSQGEPNLVREIDGLALYYHSQEGAEEEARNWFAQLDLTDVSILYMYGIGLGYSYEAAKNWIHESPSRCLVYLEDELSVLHRLFETERGTELLKDPQVRIIYFEGLEDKEGALECLYWNYALAKMAFSSLGLYSRVKSHHYADLKYKISFDAAAKNALIAEYLQCGASFFKNFYPNMLMLHHSLFGNQLFGKFKGVPAIICGAGPSLEKQLPLLKKIRDRALIFAGGSALNALGAAGLSPDFGGAIDPNPTQYERLISCGNLDIPYFYRNRLFHPAFELIKGPRLYLTGTGGYDVSNFYEQAFGIDEPFFDEGHNVVNFLIQIAYRLGCDPIVCIGVDLAFTNGMVYAPGVVEDRSFDLNAHLDPKQIETLAIKRTDVNGNEVETLWKWIAESTWIGDFANEYSDVQVVNCTEGGIGFPGVENCLFESVVSHFPKLEEDLKNRIAEELTRCAFQGVTAEKLTEKTMELKGSLERSIGYFETLTYDAQRLIKELKETGRIPEITQSGEAALAEIELEDEPAYRFVLDIFNQVITRLISRELQKIRVDSELKTEVEKLILKSELNSQRFAFLIQVARVNLEAIDLALKNKWSV